MDAPTSSPIESPIDAPRAPPRRDWLPHALAVIAWIALALGTIALIAGFFPGREIYKDASDCVGEAFARLASAHDSGDRHECVRRYVLVRTEAAGGWWLAGVIAPILLGALAVWRRPRTLVVLAWILASFAAAIGVFVATFDLDIFDETHILNRWPAHIVDMSLLLVYGMQLLTLLVLPFVHLARALERRRAREAAQPVFPRAVARPKSD